MGSFTLFPYDENFVDLTLVQFGWEQCEPLHSFGPHVRNNFLFHYIISGSGYVEYSVPNQPPMRYWLKPRCGFLICPGQMVTYCADKYDPWKYEWFEFSGIQAQKRLMLAGLSESSPIYMTNSMDSAITLEAEFQKLISHPEASAMRMIGRLYILLDTLVTCSQMPARVRNQSKNSYYVNEAMVFIQHNYVNSVTVEDIAKHLGLSRTHLGRLFKKITGQSPQKYLTHYRLSKAIDLMRTTELPLSEIAVQVGYSNQLYFSKVFHNIYGMPPSIWRQKDHMVVEPPEKI